MRFDLNTDKRVIINSDALWVVILQNTKLFPKIPYQQNIPMNIKYKSFCVLALWNWAAISIKFHNRIYVLFSEKPLSVNFFFQISKGIHSEFPIKIVMCIVKMNYIRMDLKLKRYRILLFVFRLILFFCILRDSWNCLPVIIQNLEECTTLVQHFYFLHYNL